METVLNVPKECEQMTYCPAEHPEEGLYWEQCIKCKYRGARALGRQASLWGWVLTIASKAGDTRKEEYDSLYAV